MISDYAILNFALEDIRRGHKLDSVSRLYLLQETLESLLEYILERDQPKRELILMKKPKSLKKLKPLKKIAKPKPKVKRERY